MVKPGETVDALGRPLTVTVVAWSDLETVVSDGRTSYRWSPDGITAIPPPPVQPPPEPPPTPPGPVPAPVRVRASVSWNPTTARVAIRLDSATDAVVHRLLAGKSATIDVVGGVTENRNYKSATGEMLELRQDTADGPLVLRFVVP